MHDQTRRDFLATTAAIGAAGLATGLVAPLGFAGCAQQAGRPPAVVRVGLVGCGGRGSGAADGTPPPNPRVDPLA